MSSKRLLLVFGTLLLLVTSCATSVDVTGCVTTEQVGFWHGFISEFSFFISLFDDSVAVYDVNNSGGWYDFGFWWALVLQLP